jgi:transcriptional regulator with XRE-family HTH domain
MPDRQNPEVKSPQGRDRWVLPPGASASPLTEVLATNLRTLRTRKDFTQETLAADMQRSGFPWFRETVAQIEGGRRRVALDEALALSLVLDDEDGELYDCDGPISLSGSLDVSSVRVSASAKTTELIEARRRRERLRRRARDRISTAWIARQDAEQAQEELDAIEQRIAQLESREKP